MRCKNCGSENDNNLYICQNCGSPLYDEDENVNAGEDATKVFSAVGDGEGNQPLRSNEERLAKEREDKKKKQSIAIIAALAVILIALIAGIVAMALKNKEPETTTLPVTVSEASTESTTKETTTESTTKETTTETTTESTTESTTKETTTAANVKYTLTTTSNDGGETEGDGTYELGENATVIARPDDGYSFDGWYVGDKKVSSSTAYTFTVTENVTLKAIFTLVNEEPDADGQDGIEGDD